GGEVSETCVDVYPSPQPPLRIRFRPERARALIGADVPNGEMERSLSRLGMAVTTGSPDAWTVQPPSWPPDVTIEPDLTEEVARRHGYDGLPSLLPGGIAAPGSLSDLHDARALLRQQFLAHGCTEANTSSLLSRAWLEATGFASSPAWPGGSASPVSLLNPLS